MNRMDNRQTCGFAGLLPQPSVGLELPINGRSTG